MLYLIVVLINTDILTHKEQNYFNRRFRGEHVFVLQVFYLFWFKSNGLFFFAVRRCYCEGHCPDHQKNGTCEVKAGGLCFASSEPVYNPVTDAEEREVTYGCLPANEGSHMQVCLFASYKQ